MNFSTYFNEWLYGESGYYRNYKDIGKEGDFYTAVSSSKFFGGSIANRILKSIDEGFLTQNSLILEIGAHRGYLLADIIEFIYTLRPELLKSLKFGIVEPFENLQNSQKSYFKDSFGDEIELLHHKSLERVEHKESAFIVANEIFDALNCELIYQDKMASVKNHKIEFSKSLTPYLSEMAKKYNIEKGEIAVGLEEFAKSMRESIDKFEFVTFDYGDLTPRNEFSIRVYQNHNTYPLFDKELNLEQSFQKSDITYDVNFQHLIDSFEANGIKKIDYSTQLKALVDFGITELLQMLKEKAGFKAYEIESSKVKILIHPSMMGERFKMVRFRRD